MQRRDFIKSSLSIAALSSLSAKSLAQGTTWVNRKLTDDLPIAKVDAKDNYSLDFNGDNIDRPHDILWNIDGYIATKGGEPSVSEELDVVVVGGGISGLSTAYYLRNKKIAVLEQDTRLGGNSKGELYKDVCYSIGAAYLAEPAPEAPLAQLLTELEIADKARRETSAETSVFFKNKVQSPFWEGATAKGAEADFKKLFTRLQQIYNEADFSFEGEFAKQTDKLTVDQWVAKEFGDLHPHLLEYMQLYGWSSFCGSTEELSAFQYLGFLSAETGALLALPGGNSYVAHKMALKIRKDAGERSLRSGCMVLRVETEKDSVTVLYVDEMDVLRKVRAKHVVMACPKFVAKRLIPEMSDEQGNAIKFLPYRAYLVANLMTKKPIQSPSYELYCLKGSVPPAPTAMNRGDRSFSDICFGSWAQQDKTEHSVLTLYHGLPYDGARQFLFNPASHDKYKNKYLTDVEPILSALNLTNQDVHGIRLTRWGHAVPLSQKGLISEGSAKKAAAPIKGRILFANQDNWMTPCFEAGLQAALEAAQTIANSK